MDTRGQISLELVLVVGLIFVIVMGIASVIGEDNELNQAMGAARSGAIEGANMDSFAVYPQDAFNNYTSGKSRLLGPTSVKIIKINYTNEGSNNTYNKTKIQLRITASAPSVTNSADRNSLGDRLNFYARKSICESFGTGNLTNSLYNPSYSNRYVFTTADVTWV
jgi:uncharacterized protein (UPF0333 family)